MHRHANVKDRLIWERDGRDWPNREASRFVRAAGIDWHVQQMGEGPVLLLLHGTGASTHSWRALAPLLARRFTIVAPDLPGHGFTEKPREAPLSLPYMARVIGELLQELRVSPALAAGHSAGAAIAIRMTLDERISPRGLVGLNAALLPFRGVASHIFSPLAKLLVVNPLVPRLFAQMASGPRSVQRLLRDTGSSIEPRGIDLYARLVRNPTHVSSALGMMAAWDLHPLVRDIPRLAVPLLLVTGTRDLTVPAEDAFKIRGLVPHAKIEALRGLGHLAHEERPETVAEILGRFDADLVSNQPSGQSHA